MVLNIQVNTFFSFFLWGFGGGGGGGGGGLFFLYGCLDCPSCPANAIQMGRATWAAWTSKKEIQPEFIIINCKIGE